MNVQINIIDVRKILIPFLALTFVTSMFLHFAYDQAVLWIYASSSIIMLMIYINRSTLVKVIPDRSVPSPRTIKKLRKLMKVNKFCTAEWRFGELILTPMYHNTTSRQVSSEIPSFKIIQDRIASEIKSPKEASFLILDLP